MTVGEIFLTAITIVLIIFFVHGLMNNRGPKEQFDYLVSKVKSFTEPQPRISPNGNPDPPVANPPVANPPVANPPVANPPVFNPAPSRPPVGYEAPGTVLPSAWRCIGYDVPMRFNVNGDVECMSQDGENCIWDGECGPKLDLPSTTLKPITCGIMHNELYGITGYDQPDHWCAKSIDLLND